jgi:ring-1,2-phenylacetyl-CoA epoxidase subunit PaaD
MVIDAAPAPAVAAQAATDAAWAALASVADPEIPVLSIVDLGIVRAVEPRGERLVVRVTPTYSGCPATDVIVEAIRDALREAGFANAEVEIALAPAWTSDWISAQGRRRLAEYGIAPPAGVEGTRVDVSGISPLRRAAVPVECPRCGSRATRLVSQFGSTACKALMRCDDCLEPFDYFKPH